MAEVGTAKSRLFISRAGENAEIAQQIDAILRAAGYDTFIQDHDFGHTSFMAKMREGFGMVDGGAKVLALLSPHYLKKDYCLVEAEHPLIGDPSNRKQGLIVLRVADCKPDGFLKAIPYVDLVPLLLDVDKFTRAVVLAVGPRCREQVRQGTGALVLHPEIRGVPGFTGRNHELEAVEAALWGAGAGTAALTATSAAVKGLGGVGKSVLAQEYAWRNRGRYQGVWWIRAEKSETLLDDIIALGARFIPGIREVPDRMQAAHAALDYIANMAGKPWLLVYDNVEEPRQIESLTPHSGAHVLITTRWFDWGKAAAPIKVGVFPPNVAAQYLQDAADSTDRAGAEKLAVALGYLPLALDHAAAYIRRTGIAFATYEKLAADLIQKAPKGVDYDTPVFATFSLAIDRAAQACPEAQKLMSVCAFLAPDRIPLDIFTKDMSEIERGEAVAALQEVSLATLETLDDGSQGLSVHRLVQEVMRGRLKETKEHENAAALATELVADAFPLGDRDPGDVRNWPACARLLPHARAVFERAPTEGEAAFNTRLLLNQTALHYKSRAAWVEAEPLYRQALAIGEASVGPDHPSVATSLNNLAGLLRATNRPAEAELLYRRALAIGEASLGPEHPSVAIRLNNLAELLQDTNRLAEAEPLCRRALAIGEASLGPEHPSVAIRLNNLAELLRDTNRLADAEPLYRRALAISEASFGPDHPNVATSLNNLAGLLRTTGRLAEAEPLYRRALAIDEASLGPDHPRVATGLNNLALLLRVSGRLADAEPLYRRARAIDEASFGPDHPDVATDLNNLALLLQITGRVAEAEPLMRRALRIFETSLGPDHPSTHSVRNSLAALEAEMREGAARASPNPDGVAPPAKFDPEQGEGKPGLLGRLFGRNWGQTRRV